MADIAHKLTEQQLADLEQEIADVYKQAAKELEKTIEDYFKQFEQRDAEMKKLVESGEVTKEHYTQWRLNQIGRGKRFEAMRDEVAKRYTKANSVALAYVNDRTPGIYSLNRSYEAFRIGEMAGVDFAAWDEQTVRRMIVKHPETMPYYPKKKALKRGIDLEYGKSYISKSTTSGILRGLSPYQIADELQVGVKNMNRTSAVRAARTAITSAQNGGRMDSYREAAEMGIEVKRMWMATLDGRTRHEHRLLDGQIRALDEPFSVEGEEIMFPGDASASPSMVYNCRCTLVPKVGKYGNAMQRRARNDDERNEVIEYKTYKQWYKEKTGHDIQERTPKKAEEPKTRKMPVYVPVATLKEAEEYAQKYVDKYKTKYTGTVDYGKIDVEYANEMNRALTEVLDSYDVDYPLRNIKPFNRRELRFKDTTAEAAYQWGNQDMFFNKEYYKTAKAFRAHAEEAERLLGEVLDNIDVALDLARKKTGMAGELQVRYLEALKETRRATVYMADAYGSTIHELGHYLDDRIFRKSGFDIKSSFEKYAGKVSAYATSSTKEYVAESFAAYWKGETGILDPELVKLFEGARK